MNSQNMNKKNIAVFALIIIFGGSAFYGGMRYAQSKASKGLSQTDSQNLRNLSPEERQQRFSQIGSSGRAGGRQSGVGFVSGEIISKDDKSVTVKLRDGGSRIIFFSDSTEIVKSASGTPNDLEIGKNIAVNGAANSDGSLTAQSIQIRPIAPPAPPAKIF